MIKTKTLFILGAGASKPFGYPTGAELRDLIIGQKERRSILSALNVHGDDDMKPFERHQDSFIDEFRKSSVYSIDSFLEHRPEFMAIGKINIAAYIIRHEHDAHLRVTQNNWYMYLFDRLNRSIDKINEKKISFITFNYDRSLEQFLFEAVKSRFGPDNINAIEIMKSIPIVHLYGQLDLLQWQGREGSVYNADKKYINRLRSAPINIKLISSERDNGNPSVSAEFNKAHELIRESEQVFMLGFGFDETNLDRLHVELMAGKRLCTTGVGIDVVKKRWIDNYFRRRREAPVMVGEILFPLNCIELLQSQWFIDG
jgi:hypothetical protein